MKDAAHHYKLNLRPIQEAFAKGEPRELRLFDTPVAWLPWINDTHRDPNYSTMEKVPITFFLDRDADVTISIKDQRGRSIWETTHAGRKGFNQVRWDLVRERVDSPRPYFTQYYQFARAGEYTIQVSGAGIDLQGGLKIVDRSEPLR